MIKYHNKKVYVTVDEMNEHLDYCKKYRNILFADPNKREKPMGFDAYIEDSIVQTMLTYREGKSITTYICRKDNGDSFLGQVITGGECYCRQQRSYKIPKQEVGFSASAFTYYNPEYERKRFYAYSYDINSAYANVLYNYPFPDTTVDLGARYVGENEIGFDGDGELRHEGQFALHVFPLIESPLKKFVAKWYSIKERTVKNDREHTLAKNMLCYCIGMWQHHNPFLRAYVINTCNEYIKSLMDENTVYCNTDCIVSLVPREDFKLGTGIGQWKKEEGMFCYIGSRYQWNLERPSYPGIPNKWFPEGWDLLKDELPQCGNTHYFDKNELQLKETGYEKE